MARPVDPGKDVLREALTEQQSARDARWFAVESVAEKIGCASETLRKLARQVEGDRGRRAGLTIAEGG